MVNSVYPEKKKKRTEEITGTSGLVKWAFFPRYCTNLVSRSQTALPLHITHAEVTTTFLFFLSYLIKSIISIVHHPLSSDLFLV